MEFHHVGVATSDAEEFVTVLKDRLGLQIVHEERFDGLRIAFLDLGPAKWKCSKLSGGPDRSPAFSARAGRGSTTSAFQWTVS